MNDLTPLLRAAIGFDRLSSHIEAARSVRSDGYPPYNIESLGDDRYRLTIAAAGFSPSDVDVSILDGALVIHGQAPKAGTATNMIYRGISGRPFRLRFPLYEQMAVEGATMDNGLLHVELRRIVPDALKPRRIEIKTGPGKADPAPEAMAA